MGRVVRAVIGVGLTLFGVVTGNFALVAAGVSLLNQTLTGPRTPRRAAAAATLQIGEQPRQAVFGRSAVGGTLVDAFNFGGRYGTDWEVLVIALADHRCDALEGFFVDDTYVAFTGDGNVAGFNSQLQVFFRDGRWDQTVPAILTTNGPGWTANDRGRGVAWVAVAYKLDAEDARNPIFPSGRPRFRWVVRGLRCYDPRLDSTVGGSGAHRRDNPATWQFSENPIVIRHNWVRGIYAGDRVTEPGMLLIGRGLSDIEAPPANVFPRANLCDEIVGGQPRYRIGGVVGSTEAFIEVESDFAAAVAGTISQPQGAVEVDPGQAKAPVAHFTDGDLVVGSKVIWNEGILGQQDDDWVNTVVARFIDPAQRWAVRGAPVRRDLADVIADGAPREAQPQLDLVTNAPQAQRVAEIIRRFGRLWGRAQVTLPPRFAFIEEGDWVTWQSDRYFGGATFTFRVDAWGSGENWHHQLNLRQISASVFSDTAPLDDGVIASTQGPRVPVEAPGAGAWNAALVLLGGGSVRVPNIRIGGAIDDPAAQFVVFEYVPQVAAPGVSTIWTFAANSRPDVTLLDIPVPEGGTFWVGVSYIVDGIQGERRVIGPISTTGLAYGDGSPVAPVATGNPNRVPFSLMEGDRGWSLLFNPAGLSAPTDFGQIDGLRFFRAVATATAAGQAISIGQAGPAFRLNGGERVSVRARVGISDPAAGFSSLQLFAFEADGVTQASIAFSDQGPSIIESGFVEFFAEVPVWARFGRIELYGTSAAAGVMSLLISEPMITNAAPGQTVHPAFSPGPNSDDAADVTALAQRSIVPEFPVIEIKQGEAGNVGNRTVSHTAKRGTATLTGGVWSLVSENLGTGNAEIDGGTGAVTLSGIVQSGSYGGVYTHTDGISTPFEVNVTYVPTPGGGGTVTQLKTGFVTTNAGTANNNNWQNIATLTLQGAQAGTASLDSFTGSSLGVSGATGTADFEARLLINGIETVLLESQNVVTGGVLAFADFSGLFIDAQPTPAGNVTFIIQLRRTSGSGVITSTTTRLEATIFAT